MGIMLHNKLNESDFDHRTFGGYIIERDFNGYTSAQMVAQRIESDYQFDRMCGDAIERRRKYKERLNHG